MSSSSGPWKGNCLQRSCPGGRGWGKSKTGFLRNFPILFCPVAVLSKKRLSCFLWFPFHFQYSCLHYIYYTCTILLSINSGKRLLKSYTQKRLSFANGNVYKSSSQTVLIYYCREINFAFLKLYSKQRISGRSGAPGGGEGQTSKKEINTNSQGYALGVSCITISLPDQVQKSCRVFLTFSKLLSLERNPMV